MIPILPFEINNFLVSLVFSCPVMDINITMAANTYSRSYNYKLRHASIATILGLFIDTTYICVATILEL